MEELVDIFDENTGKKTGKIISKKEAHKKGIWHSAVHLFIISKDKTKTLLQQRCKDKDLFPCMWDIAVGGHISAGEEPIVALKRELSEELGLNPDNYNIEYITTVKEIFENNSIISKEFVSTFVIYSDVNIDDIVLQKEEVSDIKWVTKKEFNYLIEANQIISHEEKYKILNDILID